MGFLNLFNKTTNVVRETKEFKLINKKLTFEDNKVIIRDGEVFLNNELIVDKDFINNHCNESVGIEISRILSDKYPNVTILQNICEAFASVNLHGRTLVCKDIVRRFEHIYHEYYELVIIGQSPSIYTDNYTITFIEDKFRVLNKKGFEKVEFEKAIDINTLLDNVSEYTDHLRREVLEYWYTEVTLDDFLQKHNVKKVPEDRFAYIKSLLTTNKFDSLEGADDKEKICKYCREEFKKDA